MSNIGCRAFGPNDLYQPKSSPIKVTRNVNKDMKKIFLT